jgi:hypothetical protein
MMMERATLAGRVFIALGALAALAGPAFAQPHVNSTKTDFYLYGSQPKTPDDVNFVYISESGICASCHGDYEESHSPYERWRYTMMSQSFRDPIAQAAMQVAEHDATGASDMCQRCHIPMAWLQNRANSFGAPDRYPTDTEGVSCCVCHRSVDPDYKPGISPQEDLPLLQALGINRPHTNGQGGALASSHLVIDTQDRRRGPFDLGNFFYHQFIESPFHRTSDICAACHDVSNPLYVRQPDGAYTAGTLDAHHPTGNKYDMFPVERLWSEWKQSAFGQGPVTMTNPDGSGRYGGYQVTSYSTCEDCHMSNVQGTGCAPFLGSPLRDNDPQHNFNGANSWVQRAVNDLFDFNETHMDDPALMEDAIGRAITMLQRASDMDLQLVGDKLRVRVTNQGGHKLPSGYAEGRRMWLNVRFYDSTGALVAERGGYNAATGALYASNTKVYECKQGVDAYGAQLTGLPPGESFHFALNNATIKDNRIPPRGFTNAAFAAVQSQPVGASYADGQYWDDTYYTVPPGAFSAQVNLYHQTSTKEYIEFLRDNASAPIQPSDFVQPPEGSTSTTLGQVVHEEWVKFGRSVPTLMDSAASAVHACKPDIGRQGGLLGADGLLDNNDFIVFIGLFFTMDPLADIGVQGGFEGSDGLWNNNDFIVYINQFFNGCP